MNKSQFRALIISVNVLTILLFIGYLLYGAYCLFNDIDLYLFIAMGLAWMIATPLLYVWGNYASDKMKKFNT